MQRLNENDKMGRMLNRSSIIPFLVCMWPFLSLAADDVRVVATLPTQGADRLYPGNREPPLSSPLVKLPIGSIAPRGWLPHMLELEANGMSGRLPEVSQWGKGDGDAWTDPKGQGRDWWEKVPDWLQRYGGLW